MPASSPTASTSSARRPPASSRSSTPGYLIVVTQLPGGASLARTDAVNRQVVDTALQVPGVAHAVNFAGFSGATFTNAPNSGAIFLPLEPFEVRARDPKKSAAAIQGALFQRLASIQEALVLVVMPPPVRGIGTSGGFRMMVEDRVRRRPAGAAGRRLRHDGPRRADAGPRAGLLAVRGVDAAALSRHRPHQGADARRQHVRRVRGAADLSGLDLRQRLQPAGPRVPRHGAGRCRLPAGPQGRAQDPRAQLRAATRCRSAPSPPCATSPAPTACRATTSIRPPSSTARPRPASRRARRSS